ncbi:SCO family protein [Pseudoflavitalea sp. G-6-1-2]|uniref:SCO family protein n=1 Tax=Pseudoflavitalea sp. G-6-1-2 TaxID=2728841 RepID=UPI00146BB9D4|nr:SCO family protein [Pseudoflavitalea sp. G-6-1-2]NML21964.1 SCO family protein [Pseudoflavitalea sp. G-6-1-2]
MVTKFGKIAILLVVGITVTAIIFLAGSLFGRKTELPFPGPPDHEPGAFSFVNQYGQTITQKDVAGKVTVVEYFFTTCPGICKVMNKNLGVVYETFKDRKDVCILSHTVNPENDTVQVLNAYAQKMHAEGPVWQFLTGDKEKLYKAARIDYLLAVEDPPTNIADDFIHTEYVALLDKKRRIRGFYDATKEEKVKELIAGIKQLLEE